MMSTWMESTWAPKDTGLTFWTGFMIFRVPGGMWHRIVISKDGESYDETGTFVSGASYRFTI